MAVIIARYAFEILLWQILGQAFGNDDHTVRSFELLAAEHHLDDAVDDLVYHHDRMLGLLAIFVRDGLFAAVLTRYVLDAQHHAGSPAMAAP